MQRKQVRAMRRRMEAWRNCAPREAPAVVTLIGVPGSEEMAIVCAPEDWRQTQKVRMQISRTAEGRRPGA